MNRQQQFFFFRQHYICCFFFSFFSFYSYKSLPVIARCRQWMRIILFTFTQDKTALLESHDRGLRDVFQNDDSKRRQRSSAQSEVEQVKDRYCRHGLTATNIFQSRQLFTDDTKASRSLTEPCQNLFAYAILDYATRKWTGDFQAGRSDTVASRSAH